jgi:hypothetical protein
MDASSLKATPPPDEKTVRNALLRVLRDRGLEPRDGWVSVRVVNAPWPRDRTYTVIIAYHPARVALLEVLQRATRNAETHAVGVWVLNESEARHLSNGLSRGRV